VATVPTRRLVYQLAVMRGDAAAAARQLEWAKGKSREFDIVAAEAQVAAFSGQLRRASELYGRSVALADGQGLAETGLSYLRTTRSRARSTGVPERRWRSRAGARAPGRARASDALPRVRLLAALGLLARPEAARIGRRARPQMPESTLVKGVILPTTRGAIALGQGRPAAAIEELRAAADLPDRRVAALIPLYLRAEAYLRAGEARKALDEYRKLLANRGPTRSRRCARWRRSVARALRAAASTTRRRGLQAFLDGVGGRPTRTFRSSPSTRGAPEALAPDAARGRCIVTTHGARPVGRALR
jgi:tetratricopeptide (TPR) repeat protein